MEYITSKINKHELEYVLVDPRGSVGLSLKKRSERVVVAAKAQVGVRTGRLRRSIKTYDHMRRGFTIQSLKIGTKVNYGYYHHEGTRPGRYTRRTMINTPRGGVRTMRQTIDYRGTRPNRFLSDNVKYIYL